MSDAAALLTCPQGHLWEKPTELGGGSGMGDVVLCPECGLAMRATGYGNSTPPAAATTPPPDSHDVAPAAGATPTFAADARGERGRFRILRPHASGGLGRVSLARDEELGRDVALKEMQPEVARHPVSRERFLNEARITSRLEHPNIVPVYALGRDESGRPYYVMRFVHGRTLHRAVREYHAGPDPTLLRDLLRRFVEVCQAVAYAHSRGIIHRDLKPANVMLGEYGQTLVVDWGIAKDIGAPPAADVLAAATTDASTNAKAPADAALTQGRHALGTRAYMAPEQATDASRAGPASDVYSLGAMLWEIVTGKPPHQPDVPNGPAPHAPLTALSRALRPLGGVSRKATAAGPSDRYPSASALAAEVERFLADEPVTAYRDPSATRALRWARNHRTPVAAAAVLLLSAVAALSVTTVLVTRQRNARELALREKQEALAQAKLERDRADGEARVARAVHDFLNDDLLKQASVYAQGNEQAPDPDLKVRDALDRAAERVHGRFQDQPLVEAAIRATIGNAYVGLGQAEKAEPQLKSAVELRQRALGPRHPLTLVTRTALASAMANQRHYDEAEPHLLDVLATQRQILGEQHVETLATMNALASVYTLGDTYEKALSLRLRVLELSRELYGERHEITLDAALSLVRLLLRHGLAETDRAQEILTSTLARSGNSWGPHHPSMLIVRHVQAIILRRRHKLDEAEGVALDVLDAAGKVLAPRDTTKIDMMINLALIYEAQGRRDDASRTTAGAVAFARSLNSPFQLADALGSAGRIEAGVQGGNSKAYVLESVEIARRAGDRRTLRGGLIYLTRALKAEGRHDETLPLQREILALSEDMYGAGHWMTANARAAVAQILTRMQQYEESEALLLQADRELASTSSPPNEHEAVWKELAVLYERWGKSRQAETWRVKLGAGTQPTSPPNSPSLHAAAPTTSASVDASAARSKEQMRAYEALEACRHAGDDRRLDQLLTQLTSTLREQRQYAEVLPLVREWLSVRERIYSPGDWRIPSARGAVGHTLMKLHRYEEAEALLLAAEREFAACPPPASAGQRSGQTYQELVVLYEQWGKPEHAAKWRMKVPAPASAPSFDAMHRWMQPATQSAAQSTTRQTAASNSARK